MNAKPQLYRTLLFAPGNDERKIAKVGTFGADVVVLDLEDAVADREKVAARSVARAAVQNFDGVTVFIRVNPAGTGLMEDDIASIVVPQLDGIILPKVEDPDALQLIDAAITEAELQHNIQPGAIQLLGLIETAKGLIAVDEIAAAAPSRTLTLCFGQGDFSTDLGIELTHDATEVLYARSRIVLAARAAGLAQPIDGPFLDLKDLEALRTDSERASQLGFQGRITIYPPQVAVVQEVFGRVDQARVQRARTIVKAFESAEADGVASIQVAGEFVDYPIYEREKRVLALVDQDESSPPLEKAGRSS